ncbi:GlsB/YeaQ/YmgE family stress response membrane protein [Pengzhenrongella frigida]|uniref:GlsB/YeaQ/YmgE family stress response membrane protein n=1 Tax=Pengzhenrongella frigida TaxID=1259133 RepID=A0A4Q5N2H4_9MICO|nr:GlsB/YeaQ/YmgE family stress response membrane protein [Cellulomonas sp. HLT2-17]RYV51433.1 GlsB/YeaQ/YmgE family stress response membrane protein [Cellulomonas sp. HLT2-17]
MTVTGFITAIVIGAIIGALGRLFAPGRQNISLLVTIIVGIVAALLGTALANAVSSADTSGIDWIELLFQIVLAVVGVTLAARLTGKRA